MKLACLAVAAVCRDKLLAVAEIEQGICALIYNENDIAAVTAVTAVGSAVGNILFPTERNTAVAAVSCLDIYFHMVIKISHFVTFYLSIQMYNRNIRMYILP